MLKWFYIVRSFYDFFSMRKKEKEKNNYREKRNPFKISCEKVGLPVKMENLVVFY